MDTSEKRLLDDLHRWLSRHEHDDQLSSKVRRYRALLRTNRALRCKLHKLQQLHETKSAQHEAARAASLLERELYDAVDTSHLDVPGHSKYAELGARMRRLSTLQKKQQFLLDVSAKFSALVGGVKEHAASGRIDDDVIDSCLQIFGQEHPHVLFVPTAVVQSILISGADRTVFEALDAVKARDYGACFFALCDERPAAGARKHWSLLLYSRDPPRTGVYHYDSALNENRELARKFSSLIAVYFDTQQFFEVRCVQQQEAGESGLHVVENVTKLLPMLETGKITVDNVDVSMDNISLLKVFPLKCRVLIMKLHLQRKLQLFLESVAS